MRDGACLTISSGMARRPALHWQVATHRSTQQAKRPVRHVTSMEATPAFADSVQPQSRADDRFLV